MSELMDIRFNKEKGYFELLVSMGDDGELWVPAGTEWARNRIPFTGHVSGNPHLSIGDYPLTELLEMEGWTPPSYD